MSKPRIRRVITATAIGAASFTAGNAIAHNTPNPRPCYINGSHSSLPSGDSARFSNGKVRVCTDGTFVTVTSYGN